MRRRAFVALLGAASLCRASAAAAQQTGLVRRIGYLDGGSAAGRQPLFAALRERLRALGYVEGATVVYDARYAEGRAELLPGLAGELLALHPDALLVATTTAVLAAKAASATVPIVMIAGADPVASGLVESLPRPGGNLTGVANGANALTGKRLELLKEMVPAAMQVAVLLMPQDANSAAQLRDAEMAARRLGVELQPILAIRRAKDVEAAFLAAVAQGAGAAIRMVDPLTIPLASATANSAATHRLPVIYPWRQNAEAGGLVAYGASLAGQYVQAADLMAKILKGAKPADLPVEQPTKFELVVNLKTAGALDLAVPQSILARADEVIE